MAKRQNTRKVPSDSIQGPNSYVVVRQVEFGMLLEAAEKADSAKRNPREEKDYTQRLLNAAVIEWDWVDDDGVALPLPSQGLDVEKLLTQEVTFLVDHITGRDKERVKNSS